MKRVVVLALVVGCRFDLPEVVDAPSRCPADFAPLEGGSDGHVYWRVPTSEAWDRLDDICKSAPLHAYLAVPDDAIELAGLHALAGDTFWVGLTDASKEGAFVTTTGSQAAFLPWAQDEPSNWNGVEVENCVESTATSFNDEACGIVMPGVCECEP